GAPATSADAPGSGPGAAPLPPSGTVGTPGSCWVVSPASALRRCSRSARRRSISLMGSAGGGASGGLPPGCGGGACPTAPPSVAVGSSPFASSSDAPHTAIPRIATMTTTIPSTRTRSTEPIPFTDRTSHESPTAADRRKPEMRFPQKENRTRGARRSAVAEDAASQRGAEGLGPALAALGEARDEPVAQRGVEGVRGVARPELEHGLAVHPGQAGEERAAHPAARAVEALP